MARLTAQQALRNVLAIGWKSDALAVDTAVQALMDAGETEHAARRAVEAALPGFQIMGAN